MGESGREQSTLRRNIFVGRERELAELVSACESGADSDAHLFLLYGEPGIGKTRLADELASRAKVRGLQVLWGRCWEGDGAPAYWPWIQVIRTYLAALDPERRGSLALESEIASDIINNVAQIIPDLRTVQSILRPSVSDNVDPAEARFRLFDAVANFLKNGARLHPMLVVLDDLHDADEASLALLRFMARELKGAPILIVATYRDVEVRRSLSLSKLIGELSREGRTIPLSGLSQSEVAKLVEFRAGRTPDEILVSRLCDAANGNPLFVDGMIRILIAEGTIGSAGALERRFKVPSGVREAICARLDGLSPEANSILTVAAAIGNEFGFNLCQSVTDVAADEARRRLDEASSAAIVTAIGPGRYRFSHALIRAAVYEGLDTSSRVRVHREIADRLEKLYREDIGLHLAELAHHFREAGVTEKAIDYSVRAGQTAATIFAFTDAMVHWLAAVKLMEQTGSNVRGRADLLALLGQMAFEVDHAKSIQYFESAIALFESIGCVDETADIHSRLGVIFASAGPLGNAARAKEHLRRAQSVLANRPETILLARLYSTIALNEAQGMNLALSAPAARRAMEISDRLGERGGVWADAASWYAQCLVLSGQLRKGFLLFSQAFEVAVQSKRPGLAAVWTAGGYSSCLGDPRGARAWFELELNRPRNVDAPARRQVLTFLSDQTYLGEGQLSEARRRLGSEDWGIRFWLAGEWETVAALEESAAETFERTGDRVARFNWSIVLGATYLLLGEFERAETHLLYGLDNDERGAVVFQEMRARPLLARLYVSMNRLDAAAEEVARCHQIMEAGEDWRGLAGDVARSDAFVAAARGNYDNIDRLFRSALAIHRRYRTAFEEAVTQIYWGLALAAAGDRTGATEKFDAAIEIYRSRGVGPRMIERVVADKMLALGTQPKQTNIRGASQADPGSKATGAFRKEGEFWTISYQATTFRLKDAKGLHYLAHLLARPGRRIHVHDLIEAVEGSPANGRRTIHPKSEDLQIVHKIGGQGQTVDARARSEYRSRLRDLQADLDEAERMNDLGRSERLRTELAMVGEELTGSSQLGGHARAASGSAERARVLVGRNIRAIVEKIRRQHSELGRHFAVAIHTGYFCVYQPESDDPVSWQL